MYDYPLGRPLAMLNLYLSSLNERLKVVSNVTPVCDYTVGLVTTTCKQRLFHEQDYPVSGVGRSKSALDLFHFELFIFNRQVPRYIMHDKQVLHLRKLFHH